MRLGIKNGSVISIDDSGFKDSSITDSVDLSSCTILPPLIDSHVHLCMSGTDDPEFREMQLDMDYNKAKDIISNHISQHLSYGVLAVRDGGDKNAHALQYFNEYPDEKNFPVIIKVAGKAWHMAGRYGGLIGRAPDNNYSLAKAINKCPDEIDHIKVVNSGLNSLKEFGKETKPQFSVEVLLDVVKISGKLGLKVMVHANGKKPVAAAVLAGCHSIEHGFFMGEDNLKLMAEKDITWVPTACTMKAYSEHMKEASIELDVTCMNLEHQLKQIVKARELGVTIALGTDAGSIGVHHGSSVIQELSLLIAAGYSLPEAIKCATLNGAKLLGINDFGLIAKGKPASFIAVKGDPSNLPVSISSVKAICIDGYMSYLPAK